MQDKALVLLSTSLSFYLQKTMENGKIAFPIRINRYLYLKQYCSRRQADTFIEQGLVFINGKKALIGQKIEKNDVVEVKEKVRDLKKHFAYYLYNKPIGIVSHNPQKDEKSVKDVFSPIKKELFPVGRLDKDSQGLMFLTNDRRIIDKILNPKFIHEKEYEVWVDKDLKPSIARKMSKGVLIEGYKTKPAQVKIAGDRKLKVVLTEGRKHQIRRMCAALGYQVKKLKRIRIMHLHLKEIPIGEGRKLKKVELDRLLERIGMR